MKKIFNKKAALIIFATLATVYMLIMLYTPVKTWKRMEREYYNIYLQDSSLHQMSHISEIFNLYSEKAYLETQLKLAEADSVSMDINMYDSTVRLVIKGVEVHSAKIHYSYSSGILKKLSPGSFLGYFSDPFIISTHRSSLEKEPLINIKAPKDTLEAAGNTVLPDTGKIEPVYISFITNKNLEIILLQSETKTAKEARSKTGFYLRKTAEIWYNSLANILHWEFPEYHPEIRIAIPREDAKAIYRALPEHAQISVRL